MRTPVSGSLAALVVALVSLTALAPHAAAAPYRDFPVLLVQPWGERVPALATGDELYRRLYDATGRTLVQDPATGAWVYAQVDAGRLVPTAFVPGQVDPVAVGLPAGLDVSREVLQATRRSLPRPLSRPPVPAPTSGTLTNLVVFVRFAGEAELGETSASFDALFNTDPGSLRAYYAEVSYGQLTVSTRFLPAPSGGWIVSYQDAHARGYFQPWSLANPTGYADELTRYDREQALIYAATLAVKGALPAGVDVDGDDDGAVDNVTYVVSGAADGWSDLLWSHMWELYQYSVTLNGAAVITFDLVMRNQLDLFTLAHEMFHSLGAPDLYHYSLDGRTPVGDWDLMEYGRGHMSAWMKARYGRWLTLPILAAGPHTLNPLTSATGSAGVIALPGSGTEWLVVEYRRRAGLFETNLPASGLVVYRVDTALAGNADGPPDEVYVFRPGGSPYADGLPWDAALSADLGRTAFGPGTDPYPFRADGSPLDVRLEQISGAGATLSFVLRDCAGACAGRTCGDDGCGGSCGTCAIGLECQEGACGVCLDAPATSCPHTFVAPGTGVQPETVWLTGSWLGWPSTPAAGAIPLVLGAYASDPAAWAAEVALPPDTAVQYKYLVKWPDTAVQWCVVTPSGGWSCNNDPNLSLTCEPPCADFCAPAAETCNGADDDCDGLTDEGVAGCCVSSCGGSACGDDGCYGSCGTCDPGSACYDGACGVCLDPTPAACTQAFVAPGTPLQPDSVWLTGSWLGWAATPAAGAIPLALGAYAADPTAWTTVASLPPLQAVEYKYLVTWPDTGVQWCVVVPGGWWSCAGDPNLTLTCAPPCASLCTPGPETCNQQDDDCDGATDEDLAGCCFPSCVGRQCGDDGCGGSCGECDDGNACTQDDCLPLFGRCAYAPAPDGLPCTDDNACTHVDACKAGTCVGTDAVTCPAQGTCRLPGTCDPATGTCDDPAKPDGLPCDDGNACTTIDACQGGSCQGGSPVTCRAPVACELSVTCNPATSACEAALTPFGVACDDHDACTGVSFCSAGTCVGAQPVVCTASDACHLAGTCDPATGHCSAPAAPDGTPCSDGLYCSDGDACVTGACLPGPDRTCPAATLPCHHAACDEAADACTTPADPDGTPCTDGSACTRSDACQAGACVGADPEVCSAADACHLAGDCDPATGLCSSPQAPDGTPCSDDLFCTDGDACASGTCQPGAPRACPAPTDACHHAACDEAADACALVSEPSGTLCGDPTRCTDGLLDAADACDASGACLGGGTTSCAPYAGCADASHCPTSCTTSGQCVAGFDCVGGTCLVNQPPVALAGADQAVGEGAWVTLDGQASHDPEGQPLAYTWTQLSGPSVALDDAHAARPAFRSPTVFAEAVLTFDLAVFDGLLEGAAATTRVVVANDVNEAPLASALADPTEVDEGQELGLDGRASHDPNGDALAFQWAQVDGPAVELDDPAADVAVGIAPPVDADQWLTFELVVDDGAAASEPLQVKVLVHDVPAAEPEAEPVPDQAEAADVVEADDAVEPEADVTEATPEAIEATIDAHGEAEAVADGVEPSPDGSEATDAPALPDLHEALGDEADEGSTDWGLCDMAYDPAPPPDASDPGHDAARHDAEIAGPDASDTDTPSDDPSEPGQGSGSGCTVHAGDPATAAWLPVLAALALLVLRRARRVRRLAVLGLALVLATGCLSATRQHPARDTAGPDDVAEASDTPTAPDLAADGAAPDGSSDAFDATDAPAPSDGTGEADAAPDGADTACPVLPCSPGDHPELHPGPCQQIAWSAAACACVLVPIDAPTPCDDGNPCTLGDGCKDGACDPGLPDPGCLCDPADDACEAEHGDHDACTGTLHCVGGLCVPDAETLPPPCTDDGLPPCQGRRCDPSTGQCVEITLDDGDACSDGDACTQFDYCTGGACLSGAPRNCADSDLCTVDACNPGDGACSHTPTPSGEPEICNGFDDDCDGQTDEAPSAGQPALCAPTFVCHDKGCVFSCEADTDCEPDHVCTTAPDGLGQCVTACVVACPSGLGYRLFDGCHCAVPPTGADKCLIPGGWALCDTLAPGDQGYGQDATFDGQTLTFTDLGDGTVVDDQTMVLWSRSLLPSGKTLADATTACPANQAGLPGDTWRLPGLHALFGLVDFGVTEAPFWGQATFGDLGGWATWSATPAPAGGGTPYMEVDFARAEVGLSDSANALDVRCAQLPALQAVPDRYVMARQGHVVDRVTGLAWRVQNACAQCTWFQALAACTTLGDGWRVPNAKEALSLIDYAVEGCSLLPAPFGADCPMYDEYWTSTPYPDARAAALDIGIGYLRPKDTSEKKAVRCVRPFP